MTGMIVLTRHIEKLLNKGKIKNKLVINTKKHSSNYSLIVISCSIIDIVIVLSESAIIFVFVLAFNYFYI